MKGSVVRYSGDSFEEWYELLSVPEIYGESGFPTEPFEERSSR